MTPFYRPSYHTPQFMSAAPPPPAASHVLAVSHGHPSLSFDEMMRKRYADSDRKLHDSILYLCFPNHESRQQCLDFVNHLHIHKHLFMHTYVHLVSCCRGRYLHLLVEDASHWSRWNSVQQLTRQSLIKQKLLNYCAGYQCHEHNFLLAQPLVISDDDSDLLCHLLYCGRKQELYELPDRSAIPGKDLTESEEVIELLWEFLMKPQESTVARRLRASIYRMARKYAYLPHALWIPHPSIANKRDLVPGANGCVTVASMNGRDVVIKKIVCGDYAIRRRCLEMFASEAILWKTLQHKNIVPLLGIAEEGTFDMGLVSPFFKNGNIRNYMERSHPQEWPAFARRWARDLAEALEYIHSHQPPIIHGDLKGDNVLVDDAGHARLGDFGQSYASDSGKYLDSTRVGLAAYNPVYWMAPEIMMGDDRTKATDKSDIYSFGCVLYEMLSGKIPFEGLSFGDVVKRVRKGERPYRPESINSNDLLWKIAKLCWESYEARPSATRLVSLLR